MAEFRFIVPQAISADRRIWDSAYITGLEGIPWQSDRRFQSGQFIIGREIDESGKIHILWPTRVCGDVCLSTTSLPVGAPPFHLPVELARGTVHRLKSQLDAWQRIGLRLPDTFFPLCEASVQGFLAAVSLHRDDSAAQTESALAAIESAVEAIGVMCSAYANQALEARLSQEGRLNTLIGAHVQSDAAWDVVRSRRDAISLLSIDAHLGRLEAASGNATAWEWVDQQVDWALQQELKICMGPLFDLTRLPQWMLMLEQDAASLTESACAFAEKTVQRYRGRVHLWNCGSGLNLRTSLGWSDEQVLRTAVALIETVRKTDPHTPVLLTISEPWGEYLRDDAEGISPLHFADALIRADLGLSGIALEMNIGAWPVGTYPRDLVELHRLIDRWALLGVPLMVSLGYTPSTPDSYAKHPPGGTPSAPPHPAAPRALLGSLIAKPAIHAVAWKSLDEAAPHGEAPSAAPLASDLNDALTTAAELRGKYLE
ncbi:MAG: hypothetical protein D6753_13345 [Planctomycetota bacterium]|nr:MAG: hypothetical protein D6753_13345 [Planctomycetota bacterium]